MRRDRVISALTFLALWCLGGCQNTPAEDARVFNAHVRCGPGTFAIRGDGSGRYVDQDSRGRYVDEDGRLLTRGRGGVMCAAVTPPTVCGPGTIQVDSPYAMRINPDGRGRYVDQDGRGRWVEQDDTIPAVRGCLMGEPYAVED